MAIYILLWSQVEINVAIISASAPALKPLVRSTLGGTSYAKSSYAKGGLGYSGGGSSYPGAQQNHAKHGIPLSSLSRENGTSTKIQGRDRNESEENIVAKEDGIVKTIEVKIDTDADQRSLDSIRRLEFGR